MGEHKCKVGIKGSAYKLAQKAARKKRVLGIKPALVSKSWLKKHGYKIKEEKPVELTGEEKNTTISVLK
jgi:hypothetical protein